MTLIIYFLLNFLNVKLVTFSYCAVHIKQIIILFNLAMQYLCCQANRTPLFMCTVISCMNSFLMFYYCLFSLTTSQRGPRVTFNRYKCPLNLHHTSLDSSCILIVCCQPVGANVKSTSSVNKYCIKTWPLSTVRVNYPTYDIKWMSVFQGDANPV